MANYTVPADDWTALSTLMGDDYDASNNLSLYVNNISEGVLGIETNASKPTGRGIELPSFTTYSIGTGAGASFWLKGSKFPVDVYIYEVAAT